MIMNPLNAVEAVISRCEAARTNPPDEIETPVDDVVEAAGELRTYIARIKGAIASRDWGYAQALIETMEAVDEELFTALKNDGHHIPAKG